MRLSAVTLCGTARWSGRASSAYVYLPDWYQGTIPFTTTLIVLMDMGFIVAFLYFLLRPTQKKSGFQANRAVSS